MKATVVRSFFYGGAPYQQGEQIDLVDEDLISFAARGWIVAQGLPTSGRTYELEAGRLGYIYAGDSKVANGNYTPQPSAATRAGVIATMTVPSHGLMPGGEFLLGNFSDPLWNGPRAALTTPDVDTLTFLIDERADPSPSIFGSRFVSQMRISDRNPVEYANAKLGQPWRYVYNAGMGGDTTERFIERMARDLPMNDADIVFVRLGINDLIAGVPVPVVLSRLMHIYNWVVDQGRIPVAFTVEPLNSAHASYTTAIAKAIRRLNGGLREISALRRDLPLVDAYAIAFDPASATEDFRSGFAADGLHPAARLEQLVGDEIARVMAAWATPAPFMACSGLDTYGVDAENFELNDHPLMTGTSGTVSGGAGGSTAATGYTITKTGASATMTCTAGVARADGVGFDQQIGFTSVNDDDRFVMTKSSQFAARVAAGDRLQMELHVVGTGLAALKQMLAQITLTQGGITYNVSAMNVSATSMWANAFDLRLRTREFVLPAFSPAPTNFNIQFSPRWSGAGSGTIKVGRWSCRKRQ